MKTLCTNHSLQYNFSLIKIMHNISSKLCSQTYNLYHIIQTYKTMQ
jgi:hypothetical protein